MPTYAYRCQGCGKKFNVVESISEHGKAKPKCPKCGSGKVVRVPGLVQVITGKKS